MELNDLEIRGKYRIFAQMIANAIPLVDIETLDTRFGSIQKWDFAPPVRLPHSTSRYDPFFDQTGLLMSGSVSLVPDRHSICVQGNLDLRSKECVWNIHKLKNIGIFTPDGPYYTKAFAWEEVAGENLSESSAILLWMTQTFQTIISNLI